MKKMCFLLCTLLFLLTFSMNVLAAGSWRRDSRGWWYQRGDGGWPATAWQWIDGNGDGYGECYFFGIDGYMLENQQTDDGYWVNQDGMWVENGAVQRMYVGDVIDPINNPGRTVLEGRIWARPYAKVAERFGADPAGGTGTMVFFVLNNNRIFNIMNADEQNCFFTNVEWFYLPNGASLAKYDGQGVRLSMDLRNAFSPSDLEMPYGVVRAMDAYVVR